MAAPEPEEPLGQQQEDGDGDVDEEGEQLEDAERVDELVDLERDEQDRGDERQVLRPPLGQPQPDHLGRLEHGVADDEQAGVEQVGRPDQEEVPEVAEEPGQLVRLARAAGERAHDLVVVVAEPAAVAEKEEDDDRQDREHDDVDRPIDGDEAQDVTVPEERAAERQLDLSRPGPNPSSGGPAVAPAPTRRSAGTGASDRRPSRVPAPGRPRPPTRRPSRRARGRRWHS